MKKRRTKRYYQLAHEKKFEKFQDEIWEDVGRRLLQDLIYYTKALAIAFFTLVAIYLFNMKEINKMILGK